MENFVTFENGIMKSICHVYQHEDGRTLHLLPVLHIGEEQYYKDLLEYVGDKICVYEEIKFGIEGEKIEIPQNYKPPKGLDNWIARNESQAKSMDENYKKEIKRLVKKILIGDIRRLRRIVKNNLKRVDQRITQIFNQCERTGYSLANLPIMQTALASLMDLAFQFDAIDYVNDIPRKQNWIHADIDYKLPEDFDFKKMFSSPSPELIESSKLHARLLYGMLYLIETLIFKNLNERRTQLAELLIPHLQSGDSISQFAPHLVQPRNNIIIEKADKILDTHDEVVVFYGAGHMSGIKEEAVKANFQLISTIEFEVYRLVEENPERLNK